MADKNRDKREQNKRGTGKVVSGGGRYYAGGGAIARAGYRDSERYRERLRRDSARRPQGYPNRRRKIVTGKDLTTPLRGRIIVTRKREEKIRIVNQPKDKLPWLFICKIVVGCAALCLLIYSQIVLFNVDSNINMTIANIRAERLAVQNLERQYQLENDPTEILRIAREELGMVEERYIQINHIRSRREDRAVIIRENNNFFSEIFAVIFRRENREE